MYGAAAYKAVAPRPRPRFSPLAPGRRRSSASAQSSFDWAVPVIALKMNVLFSGTYWCVTALIASCAAITAEAGFI